MIEVSEIEDFLKKVRLFIEQGKIDFIKGQQEKYTLGVLGISFDDGFEMVKELTHENYYQGPTKDHKYPTQDVMEFGIEDIFPDLSYPHTSLYIKLTFRDRRDDLLMMSFHSAAKPITYPYGKDKLSPITE
ncbi:type II toxin-antitoxin system MqsR family toxin [Planococcus halotolerans]|uniref:Uncharacterized protein n=1 Tax=Planococcus halotolerans TaxID=2233542 RepID=A0A365KK51_9BACL|nr:type II toxin-antitoxin system MqsR family toxin [Planococcus halotolerans]RAZ73508.1 hypothetical protein DP120_17410 [Planococcus halotolerans]